MNSIDVFSFNNKQDEKEECLIYSYLRRVQWPDIGCSHLSHEHFGVAIHFIPTNVTYLIDIHLIFRGAVFIAVGQNLIGKGRFCARISKVEDIEIKDLDSVVKCKGELKGAVSLNDFVGVVTKSLSIRQEKRYFWIQRNCHDVISPIIKDMKNELGNYLQEFAPCECIFCIVKKKRSNLLLAKVVGLIPTFLYHTFHRYGKKIS